MFKKLRVNVKTAVKQVLPLVWSNREFFLPFNNKFQLLGYENIATDNKSLLFSQGFV